MYDKDIFEELREEMKSAQEEIQDVQKEVLYAMLDAAKVMKYADEEMDGISKKCKADYKEHGTPKNNFYDEIYGFCPIPKNNNKEADKTAETDNPSNEEYAQADKDAHITALKKRLRVDFAAAAAVSIAYAIFHVLINLIGLMPM